MTPLSVSTRNHPGLLRLVVLPSSPSLGDAAFPPPLLCCCHPLLHGAAFSSILLGGAALPLSFFLVVVLLSPVVLYGIHLLSGSASCFAPPPLDFAAFSLSLVEWFCRSPLLLLVVLPFSSSSGRSCFHPFFFGAVPLSSSCAGWPLPRPFGAAVRSGW